jgi:hypothetical protein
MLLLKTSDVLKHTTNKPSKTTNNLKPDLKVISKIPQLKVKTLHLLKHFPEMILYFYEVKL